MRALARACLISDVRHNIFPMIKVRFIMPFSAGRAGTQDKDVPSVPRIGEVVKDANNRYYKITAVVYQPFEQETYPKVLVTVADKLFVTPEGAVTGKE